MQEGVRVATRRGGKTGDRFMGEKRLDGPMPPKKRRYYRVRPERWALKPPGYPLRVPEGRTITRRNDLLVFKKATHARLDDRALKVRMDVVIGQGQELAATHVEDVRLSQGPGPNKRGLYSILRVSPTLLLVVPSGSFRVVRLEEEG